METRTTPAIIMRTREFGESDLLVTFFTPEEGLLKGVAKGARRSSKRFVNCFASFSLVSLEFGLRKRGDLYLLQSGKLIHAYPGIRSDFFTMSIASYIVELTEILFPTGVADSKMFELMKDSLKWLDEGKSVEVLPLVFEAKAMAFGGYGLNLDKCCLCGRNYAAQGTAVFMRDKGGIACLKCQQVTALAPGLKPESVNMLRHMLEGPVSALNHLEPAANIIEEIKRVLKLHREYHLGKKPKTARYIE